MVVLNDADIEFIMLATADADGGVKCPDVVVETDADAPNNSGAPALQSP